MDRLVEEEAALLAWEAREGEDEEKALDAVGDVRRGAI